MSEPWFYVAELGEPGALYTLTGEEAHHAAAVRRLHPGDMLWLFDGRGGLASARVERVRARGRELDLRIEDRRDEPPRGPALHLACALPKGDRQQVLLDMGTQLGMTRFTPLACERSVVKPGPQREDRWRKICLEACKQSKRLHVPTIDEPADVAEVAERAAAAGHRVWLAQPRTDSDTLAAPLDDVTLLVGPEGGFTDEEVERALAHGARAVGLGTTILRVETAAVALLALARRLQAL